MANLYDEIEKLVEDYQRAYDNLMILKYKMVHYGYEPPEDEYVKCEHKIQEINSKYNIDCDDMAKIISKAKGKEYRFKVFREVGSFRVSEIYTYNYVACYVNENSKYFDIKCDKDYGIALIDYEKMLNSLNDENSIIASTNKGKRGIKRFIINPCIYLNRINFIKMFTRGTTNELELLEPEFKAQIKPILKERLEQVEVGEEQNIGL